MGEGALLFLDANTLASPVTRTLADLAAHEMSAVNPDYFMALRLTESAYRDAVGLLAEVQNNPPRTEAEVHQMLGRRHPRLTARFADAYTTTPVPPDADQPATVFRGVACIRCDAHLDGEESLRVGLCAEHSLRHLPLDAKDAAALEGRQTAHC